MSSRRSPPSPNPRRQQHEHTFSVDDVVAVLAGRGTSPHLTAAAAGVDRRVLEAAITGDVSVLTAQDAGRVGRVLGIGERVLEVPSKRPVADRRRVAEAARRVVAQEDAARAHDPGAPWIEGRGVRAWTSSALTAWRPRDARSHGVGSCAPSRGRAAGRGPIGADRGAERRSG